ncbi:MAG: c-type cytochrome [Phycisphaerales bacterium]|nr:c-type cytochrome [Phycisphaerales bacterium]
MSTDTNNTGRGDKLMSHDYDGIREYDNPTPGWWHAIFLGSVVFAIVYWAVFHMSPLGDRWGVHGRYKTAADNAAAAAFAQLGTLAEDNDSLLRLSVKEAALSKGKAVFDTRCVACHRGDAGGMPALGLNLTDDFAKNFKDPNGVYNTIANGVTGTAMVPWLAQMGREDTILAAAYVVSLRGTNVAGGLPPEGEPLPEWPAPAPEN